MNLDPEGFWRLAAAQPDRVALIEPDGTAVTRGELLIRTNRLSHGLRAAGLQPGSTVTAMLPNSSDYLALVFATGQIGLRLVPLDSQLTASELTYLISDSGASIFVASKRFAQSASEAADAAGLTDRQRFAPAPFGGFAGLDQLTAEMPDTAPENRLTGQIMHYTSGTTGVPKGVRRPMRIGRPDPIAGYLSWALRKRFGLPIGTGVHLVTAPMHHAAAGGFAAQSLHMGQQLVLMDRFDAAESLRLIDRHRVTNTSVTPIMMHRWLKLPSEIRDSVQVSSLQHVLHGGAPCPIDTKRRMLDWLGPILHEYYSFSEGGMVSVGSLDWLKHPGTVGRPEPGSVRVLGKDGTARMPGETGLVYLKLPDLLRFEYLGDPEKTAAAIRDGYCTAGDLGHVDNEGWLYIDDRRADLIISGGVNIYPAEIEAVLVQHPAVSDAAVVGVPDDEWGTSAVALVELAPDAMAGEGTAADILAAAGLRLARHKLPKSIEFVPTVGRRPDGKLRRHFLRSAYLAAKEIPS
ncbi:MULTISPECIES: AMP-binding protein [Amycolatopsis]|uniref:AMP-binding protein n=1 Tax=Amycolatopsis albidoflavus TaxID=102226 RepID=A0ABW5I965_9PSEU